MALPQSATHSIPSRSRSSHVKAFYHREINGKYLILFPLPVYPPITSLYKARPCNKNGCYLRQGASPPSEPPSDPSDWNTFKSEAGFEMAEFVYVSTQMSEGHSNRLAQIWKKSASLHGGGPPFSNHKELLKSIDSTPLGGVPWQAFEVGYGGPLPEPRGEASTPEWMLDTHTVYFRDPRLVVHEMLSNSDFNGSFDYTPSQVFDSQGYRQYEHLMTGTWAWDQAVCIGYAYLCLEPTCDALSSE
jgi:hypothetical protein